MNYKITVKLNSMDRFNSSINFLKTSKTFYFDIIFTAASIVVLIFSIYTGKFKDFNLIRKIILILCPFIFTIIQPMILYFKALSNSKFNKEVTIIFDDDSITVSSSTESVTLNYINIYNIIKFKNMIVIMYDGVHGQIIPDRFLNFDKNEFYNSVSDKINYARKNDKKSK